MDVSSHAETAAAVFRNGGADAPEDHLSESPGLKALLAAARSYLRTQLQPPVGVIPTRWSSCDANPQLFDLNDTLPLVAAWRALDVAVARELLRAVFVAQADDGSLPRGITPTGAAGAELAPWPVFAQCVRLVEMREPLPAFVEEMRPRLVRYLEWAFRRYDPQGEGRPRWPTAEEALTPETWDSGLCSADLAALLLAELDALRELGAPPDDMAALRLRAEPMVRAIPSFFWDAAGNTFRDRYADGRFVARRTFSAVAPLIWRDLTAVPAREIALRFQSGIIYNESSIGVPLWEAWPDDPAPPPAPARHQALLLAGAELAGRRKIGRLLRDRLRAALETVDPRRPIAPRDFHGRQPAGAARWSLESAALTVQVLMVCPTVAPEPTGRKARWLHWMENHRMAIAGGLAAALLGVFWGVAFWFQNRKQPPGPSIEALVGLAHNHYKSGDYEAAVQRCRQIVGFWGDRQPPSIRILYGNALFRTQRYEEAGEQYRQAAADAEVGPIAAFNLAQTLIRLGRRQEALAAMDQLAREYAADFPDLAERARMTADFLREHLAESPETAGAVNRGGL